MFLKCIGICLSVCFFTFFGVPAGAKSDDPIVFNRGVAVKIKNQINKRPFIANRLSRDKQVREFLQGDSNQSANPHQQPSQKPSSAPSKKPFDAPLPHPFDPPANEPSVVLSPEPETHSNKSSLTTTASQNVSPVNSDKPFQENNRQLASASTTQGGGNNAREPAFSSATKVSYKHDTVVFYKKECRSKIGCITVPVLTNLKNVIFEYNQGRYSANSIKSPLSE